LERHHDRSLFSCGVEPLDRYFRGQVTQDIRRQVAACYLAIERSTGRIAGYYTLAAAGLPLADLPLQLARKLPRYPLVPVVRIGRLAVDLAHRGRGLGSGMIADAAKRTLHSGIAAFALIVDVKDEAATLFYRHQSFTPLPDNPNSLVVPIATVLRALEE
jgi:GNAT superfamily N-acetyltransferase